MAFFQTKHVWIKELADRVAVLVLDREQSPVNFLDPEMLNSLDRALDAVVKSDRFRLLVIRSGKTANFCHGPSPALLATWKLDDFKVWAERGQRACTKFADMQIPSACVISGSCHDAGFELALACDYRVVVSKPSTLLGFPGLDWGMIPCWGGTQRLPHLIGLENSVQMLLTGRRLDARTSWMCDLADNIEEDGDDAPPAFLAEPRKRDWSTFPTRTWRERWLESTRPGRWFLFRGAERILRTRIPDEMPAPAAMLQALRHAYQQPSLQAGLDFERLAIERIAVHPALSHSLRLLLQRDRLRLPGLASAEKSRIRQIGVIGSGAAALALLLHSITKGYDVVLRGEDNQRLGAVLNQIVQLLQAEVQDGSITPSQFQKMLAAIRGTYTWTHFDKLDMILDTTDGSLDSKQAFYQEIENQVPATALIVPITALHRVEDLKRNMQLPERMVGLHLIEPSNSTSLAEIVTPAVGAGANAQAVREWAVALGKCCLQVPDRVGGVAMRIRMPALNEAGLLVKEGVPIERIDQAMHRFGMTHGPLEWIDRLGIDHVAALAAALQPTFTGRIAFESGFSLMVDKQWLGNSSGAGFYQPGLRKPKAHKKTVELWQTQSQGENARPVPVLSETDAYAWIQRRLVTLMVLEAVRCLEEGLVKDADDLDCAMCLTGWAMHRGGPIGYGRQLGVSTMTDICAELSREHGPRFAPVAALSEALTR